MSEAAAKLEPFLLLAKSSRGAAAAKIIINATSAPGVYVFSELLDLSTIQDLSNTSHANHLALLSLFAYGTLAEYRSQPDAVPPLELAQLLKLKHLTLVSLALNSRAIHYSTISEALEIESVRELEDLIIDVMYAGLLGGKMHHDEKILHVDWVTGRDVNPQALPQLAQSLENWCQTSSTLLQALDEQIAHVRQVHQAETFDRQAYKQTRDAAYLKEAKASKKGKGNYDQTPPGYAHDPLTATSLGSGRFNSRASDLTTATTSPETDGKRSKKRFKSDEMEE